MVSLATPMAVEFSNFIGFLGCGQPIYMMFWKRGAIYLAQIKSPTSSSSAEEDMMSFIIWEIVSTGLLILLTGGSLDSMVCATVWLLAFMTLR